MRSEEGALRKGHSAESEDAACSQRRPDEEGIEHRAKQAHARRVRLGNGAARRESSDERTWKGESAGQSWRRDDGTQRKGRGKERKQRLADVEGRERRAKTAQGRGYSAGRARKGEEAETSAK